MRDDYCNLKSEECKKVSKLRQDGRGYICVNCGKRVSKWLPLANTVTRLGIGEKPDETQRKEG